MKVLNVDYLRYFACPETSKTWYNLVNINIWRIKLAKQMPIKSLSAYKTEPIWKQCDNACIKRLYILPALSENGDIIVSYQ